MPDKMLKQFPKELEWNEVWIWEASHLPARARLWWLFRLLFVTGIGWSFLPPSKNVHTKIYI